MFDQDGKLLLSDAELEAEARAVVMLHAPGYGNDALWAEHWKLFVDGMKRAPDLWANSHQGIAVRQARAAIEAWKQNENSDIERVSLATVIGEP